MDQHDHATGSGAGKGEVGTTSPEIALSPDIALAVQQAYAEAAFYIALGKVAKTNDLSLRQQVSVWRPFRD